MRLLVTNRRAGIVNRRAVTTEGGAPCCCTITKYIIARDCCDPRNQIVFKTTAVCGDGSPIWREGGRAKLLHFTEPESCYLTDPLTTYTDAQLNAIFPGGVPFGDDTVPLPCSAEGATCNSDDGCPQCDCCLAAHVRPCLERFTPTQCCELGSDYTIRYTIRKRSVLQFRQHYYFGNGFLSVGTPGSPDPCNGGAPNPSGFCYAPLSGYHDQYRTTFRAEHEVRWTCTGGVWRARCLMFSYNAVNTGYEYTPFPTFDQQGNPACPPPNGYTMPLANTSESSCVVRACPDDENPLPPCDLPGRPPIPFLPSIVDWRDFDEVLQGEACAGTEVETLPPPGPEICPGVPVPGETVITREWERTSGCTGGNAYASIQTTGEGQYRGFDTYEAHWSITVHRPCSQNQCPDNPAPLQGLSLPFRWPAPGEVVPLGTPAQPTPTGVISRGCKGCQKEVGA